MWISSLVCLLIVAQASAQRPQSKSVPEVVYPQYPEISTCPEEYGLQLYHHPLNCDQFYKCANGTLTLETCENGLLFDGKGAVHNYCNYHWGVQCEGREYELIPFAQGNCEYAFGLYPAGPCEAHYIKCTYGEELNVPCIAGLAYDERIHGCNWPDLMETCDASQFLGFNCPEYLDPKDPAARFQPFPRFASGDCSKFFTCVENKPRLISCGDINVFDEETLACRDPEYVPRCAKK